MINFKYLLSLCFDPTCRPCCFENFNQVTDWSPLWMWGYFVINVRLPRWHSCANVIMTSSITRIKTIICFRWLLIVRFVRVGDHGDKLLVRECYRHLPKTIFMDRIANCREGVSVRNLKSHRFMKFISVPSFPSLGQFTSENNN